jgi:thioredoxin reductase
MSKTHPCPVLVIGAGPAGYTAAIYAARAGMTPMLVAGLQPGGQLTITTDVENFPGFAETVQGPWLMDQMAAQAAHVGTQIVHDLITDVDFSRRPFRCVGDSGDTYLADSVIIATGAQARWLGLPSEAALQGAGVSACATCDGFFYRGRRVAVVGGGNTAVEEALYLTHHADHVTLIHRRDTLRAERILQQRLFAHPKISVIWNSAIEEITGGGHRERRGAARRAKWRAEPDRGGRRVRRHRAHAEHQCFQGSRRAGQRWLYRDHAGQRPNLRARRFRRGGCPGQNLSPGGDRRRNRLHGGARGGEVPGRAQRDIGVGGGLDKTSARSAQ